MLSYAKECLNLERMWVFKIFERGKDVDQISTWAHYTQGAQIKMSIALLSESMSKKETE